MGVTLPVTCRQLGYLVLVGLFVAGNLILIPIDYTKNTSSGFIGWLLIAMSVMFGIIALIVYIDDNDLIKCKCDK